MSIADASAKPALALYDEWPRGSNRTCLSKACPEYVVVVVNVLVILPYGRVNGRDHDQGSTTVE